MVAVWSACRLGRNLEHLAEVPGLLQDTGGLALHSHAVGGHDDAGGTGDVPDAGHLAEFEREMIAERSVAGLGRIEAKLAKDGRFETKKGVIPIRLGRPGAAPESVEKARVLRAGGTGILSAAKPAGLGTGTVHKIAREMRGTASANGHGS